jgi:drug/metabolite transporter (DMT)-like permease
VKATSRAEAALGASTVIWGSTFAIVKLAMEDISPVLLVALRFLAASLLLLVFFRKIFPLRPNQLIKGGLLGFFLFLGFVTQNVGLTLTSASKSAFITGMMVVVVPMLQVVIERRLPKIGNLVGVAIVALGLWFLTAPNGSSFNSGDALTLACAAFFAIYIVYLDVVSREMTTLQLLFIQLSSMAAYSTLAFLLFETPRFVVSARSLLSLGYLTVLATLLSSWIQTRFQKDTTPTRAAVIFSVEPVIAAGVAALLLGETMGPLGFSGGALIILGVLVSELSDLLPGLNHYVDGSLSGDEPEDSD